MLFVFNLARIVIWLCVEGASLKQRETGPFWLQVIPRICPLKMFMGIIIIL
jgi:hypothetical protein